MAVPRSQMRARDCEGFGVWVLEFRVEGFRV